VLHNQLIRLAGLLRPAVMLTALPYWPVVARRPSPGSPAAARAAEARGVPVRLLFLVVLALTVTGAAQVVGTLLVLSLATAPAGAAQRLSASPLTVAGLWILFAVPAAGGGLLASFQSNAKASVFITSFSFAMYIAARLTGPLLLDRRRRAPHHSRPARQGAAPSRAASEPAGGSAGRVSRAVCPSACGIPGRRAREPNSLGRDERYRAARRGPVPRRRV
jgi:zinc/manganese transport system permease protein